MSFALMAARLAASRLGADAEFFARQGGPGVAVRVVVGASDQLAGLGRAEGVAEPVTITVPVAALPVVQAGDEFRVGDVIYQVTAPLRDAAGASWRLACRRTEAEPAATTLLQAAAQ
jgi:hypothetical protein